MNWILDNHNCFWCSSICSERNSKDVASQCSFVVKTLYTAWLKRQFPGFLFMFPQTVETLVNRGWITIHRLIAYSLSNISAKNYQNRLMCVEVIVCNISVVFFETQCSAPNHLTQIVLVQVKYLECYYVCSDSCFYATYCAFINCFSSSSSSMLLSFLFSWSKLCFVVWLCSIGQSQYAGWTGPGCGRRTVGIVSQASGKWGTNVQTIHCFY